MSPYSRWGLIKEFYKQQAILLATHRVQYSIRNSITHSLVYFTQYLFRLNFAIYSNYRTSFVQYVLVHEVSTGIY